MSGVLGIIVIAAAAGSFGYLVYVIVRPDRF